MAAKELSSKIENGRGERKDARLPKHRRKDAWRSATSTLEGRSQTPGSFSSRSSKKRGGKPTRKGGGDKKRQKRVSSF